MLYNDYLESESTMFNEHRVNIVDHGFGHDLQTENHT